MQRWKLILAYDGTPFHGWQVQPGLPTVQGTLASALRKLTGESPLPQGSGRTDTGVHALAQVASFSLAAPIPPPNLLRALNRALPPSIRILSAEHAVPDFHARHCAVAKTYEYRVFRRAPLDPAAPERICPPTIAPYIWDCPWRLSLAALGQAAASVLGTHDFTSFAAADPDQTTRSAGGEGTAIRSIYQSQWDEQGSDLIYRISGSGFLHHMVRNLVGTFVEAAAGRIAPHSIPAILTAVHRSAAGPTAPARGLFLLSVDYPKNQAVPSLASSTWEGAPHIFKAHP